MAVFNRCPQIDELLIENNINDGVNVPKPCVPRRYTELHAQPRNNWDYPSLSIILSHRFSPDFISPRIYPRSRPSIPIWLSLVLDYFVPFSFLFFITRPHFSRFLSLPLRSLSTSSTHCPRIDLKDGGWKSAVQCGGGSKLWFAVRKLFEACYVLIKPARKLLCQF